MRMLRNAVRTRKKKKKQKKTKILAMKSKKPILENELEKSNQEDDSESFSSLRLASLR